MLLGDADAPCHAPNLSRRLLGINHIIIISPPSAFSSNLLHLIGKGEREYAEYADMPKEEERE